MPVSTHTLNRLCAILQCPLDQVAEYIEGPDCQVKCNTQFLSFAPVAAVDGEAYAERTLVRFEPGIASNGKQHHRGEIIL